MDGGITVDGRWPMADGGRLFLTNKHLTFRPHRINFNTEVVSWRLQDIVRAAPGSTPFEMKVTFMDGTEEIFVVYRRRQWMSLIERARENE
jgi:hypothetical protein